MKILLVILLCCSVLMVACVSAPTTDAGDASLAADVQPASVQDQTSAFYDFKVLAQGSNSGMEQASTVIVSDQASFGRQWPSINPAVTEVPELDFSNSYVVFAFMGQRRSGGYHYEVSLQETAGLPVLVFVESMPGLKEAVTLALTSPFMVVQLIGATEQITTRFEEKTRK